MSNLHNLNKILPSLPKKIEQLLFRVEADSITNARFRNGIAMFERYRRQYEFSDRLLYALGLFYDHRAMQYEARAKHKNRKRRILRRYIQNAEAIYQELLGRDPHNMFALYGMHRVCALRGRYHDAIRYAIRVYRERNKLPKKQRGALPVGHLYEELGDLRKAEHWYKKEYRDVGSNDFGVNVNLMAFYRNQKNYKRALPFAQKVEQLIKTEFEKPHYRGLKMRIRRGAYLKRLHDSIREIKLQATAK